MPFQPLLDVDLSLSLAVQRADDAPTGVRNRVGALEFSALQRLVVHASTGGVC